MSSILPTYFLTHGGGPWPYMKDDMPGVYDKLEASIVDIPRQIGGRPKAVLAISGHWEESDFAVSSAAHPTMIYDYSGFPEHTYKIQYKAPGSPELAARVQALLEAGGIRCRSDAERGFDHGTFSLMKPLFPDEDVPVVQLSMRAGYDPALHIAVGRLLAPLREEGVLIIGSGSSYHNLREWRRDASNPSRQFDAWLQDALLKTVPAERVNKLMHWTDAPAARASHPTEDHLIPLMVAVGAAEKDAATLIYHQDDFMGRVALSSFRFGDMPTHH